MAWLTTVRPDGRPEQRAGVVPAARRRDHPRLQPGSEDEAAANVSHNPRVALGLDVTDIGWDIIRIDGTAEHVPGFPAADQVPEYVMKYTERIGALFGTASRFASQFPEALVITPHRLHA